MAFLAGTAEAEGSPACKTAWPTTARTHTLPSLPPLPSLCPPPQQDPDTRLQFYKLMLCDPKGSWTPGRREAAALEADPHVSAEGTEWPKYRNMVVR